MKPRILLLLFLVTMIITNSCEHNKNNSSLDIVFLHHSTGRNIYYGAAPTKVNKAIGKISNKLADLASPKATLELLFEEYNKENNKNYNIEEIDFPKASPYGWHNFPYDYYTIWVKNAGKDYYMEEPTLELLTKQYEVIIFKHCFPVSNINEDLDSVDINSDYKTLSNYKAQYFALRDKLHEFPDTKFILFTGAAQVKSNITEDKALRAKEFFNWVTHEWDLPSDNIYLWDFYSLQTEGDLYFQDKYAVSSVDSHPNEDFSKRMSHLLFSRILDIIENSGNATQLTGVKI